MEPLEKDLSPGYHASLSEDGTLTIQEEQVTLNQFDEEEGLEIITTQLPAVAVRALLNLLRRKDARKRIGYRLWR